MTKRSQILEALAAGPLTQADIEAKTGLTETRPNLSNMVCDGLLKQSGKGAEALFSPGKGKRKAPGKKAKPAKKAAPRKARGTKRAAKARGVPATAPFRALVENGGALVCLRGGELIGFSEEETQAIADTLSFCYQAQPA
ncbi:MAG TPA: hypothetical protein VN667_21540 [Burkholderiales bacterium]|nr:hypothetical protein [Burkholderiales bacterium]